MIDVEHPNLLRVLADFAAWLEPCPRADVDLMFYIRLAEHFLAANGTHQIVDVPDTALAWCDLCGQQYVKPATHKPESITGCNFEWCPTCHQQQTQVFFLLGPEAYRAAWRTDGEGN